MAMSAEVTPPSFVMEEFDLALISGYEGASAGLAPIFRHRARWPRIPRAPLSDTSSILDGPKLSISNRSRRGRSASPKRHWLVKLTYYPPAVLLFYSRIVVNEVIIVLTRWLQSVQLCKGLKVE
jgi:hypothetical protein